ncbi:MAG: hypothetical protein EA391_07515 [Balneolaceae bacterium]|nr:MAG: hypothetical protein EA391_07515 [Balneolaceae bacterium]
MKKDKANYSELIGKHTPNHINTAIEVLKSVKLPVYDMYSFSEQLQRFSKQADSSTKAAIFNLERRVTGRDFPIFSLDNAIEKLFGTFRPLPIPVPFERFIPEFDFSGDFRERPSAQKLYDETYPDNPGAAACAFNTYRDLLNQNAGELVAHIEGLKAGNRFVQTGRCG